MLRPADPSADNWTFRDISDATDAWLQTLFASATDGVKGRFSLLAVGGYGRHELCPFSDLDLLLLHDSRTAVAAVANALWYPLWDAKLKVGHAVRTTKEALSLASTDVKTATAMLSGRVIAGDEALGQSVIEPAQASWRKDATRWLGELSELARSRQDGETEVAYLLEPDLKEGAGGLREVHVLRWAAEAGNTLASMAANSLTAEYEQLLRARIALHRVTGRAGDILALQEQDAVAEALGLGSADALMAAIAGAGQAIAFESNDTWRRIDASMAKARGHRPLAPHALARGVVLLDGEVSVEEASALAASPQTVVRVALAAAHAHAPIDRTTLQHLNDQVAEQHDRWPAGMLDEFVALLLEGRAMVTVMEALDRYDLVTRLLPEWRPLRAKPQRNAYHRFTVDRHLWETAANAAALADRVSRPDLLVLGALFHDIGKGYPGDHTEVGIDLVEAIAPRLGLDSSDIAIIAQLVRHHLLLPDVATRRDLADPQTIAMVAAAVETPLVLELLAALTEADSLATGPSAWGSWKAGLVRELTARTAQALGAPLETVGRDGSWKPFPSAEVLERMGQGIQSISVTGAIVTTVTPDRPGVFSRVAGVLSLHGLDVLGAKAHSDDPGPGTPAMAANEFRVANTDRLIGTEGERLHRDLERALAGQLALDARLAERARTYRRKRVSSASQPGAPSVEFVNEASATSTVIEVRAPDAVGLLYRITKALAEVGLDIRHASVQTLGAEVVDTFYVCADGGRVVDSDHLAEVRRAVLHAVDPT